MLFNFCKGDWQGGEDMPPMVTDLHVTDRDLQGSTLTTDCWLGRNVNRKRVNYGACFELSSLTLLSLECKQQVSDSFWFLGSPLLSSLGPSQGKDVGSLQLTHNICQMQGDFPEASIVF